MVDSLLTFPVLIAVLVFSIILHEIAHGYVAFRLGDDTAKRMGRLTLNPIPHLEPFGSFILPVTSYLLGGFIIGWAKPVPVEFRNLNDEKWGVMKVAAAGPVTNIILALLASLFLRIIIAAVPVLPTSVVAGHLIVFVAKIVTYAVLINLALALINLFPIPPLDGSRILEAVMPRWWQNVGKSLGNLFLPLALLLLIVFSAPLFKVVVSISELLIGTSIALP